MNQEERRLYLIRELLAENPRYSEVPIPESQEDQRRLLRSLMNIRPPSPISSSFLKVQDEYLKEELSQRGVTKLSDLEPVSDGIYLWQGDITTLDCDGIVNAANSGMTGCYVPCHACIDNCIHTYAGIELRNECAQIMAGQGHLEETGGAKITPAFNLPSRYVLHTVGPIISGEVTENDKELLASCYRSCLQLAAESGLKSVAFCCISTGEFHFPNDLAAEIAVQTVKNFRKKSNSEMEVIFNVFKDTDLQLYQKLLR